MAGVHSQDMSHTMDAPDAARARASPDDRHRSILHGGSTCPFLSQAEGASDTLHAGFIVYTKADKTAVVGVSKELLARHTAVSAEVAQAMAKGALARCPADIALAITGVAGPEPDEDGNSVGLVYVAVGIRNG